MSTALATDMIIPREVCQTIGLVGQVVTYAWQQFTVHCVEGTDWFVFDRNGETVVDLEMTRVWFEEPLATIVPMDSKIGEGRSCTVPVSWLRRGVCLEKSYR